MLIDQIAIGIMLNHITSGIPPVIEDLRAQDMPTDSPDRLIPLLRQPLMSQHLGVVVMHLERAVVHMRRWVGAQEEAVVVDGLLASVDVGEDCDGHFLAGCLFDPEEVGWHDVELVRVELDHCVEVLHAKTEVAELVVSVVLS